ncbi:hypothetical protein [Streptomyces wuyuanensis]|uniref:Lipoprotein n=1 Tax=Streptomyces wuyuanensis TaxID=1196353 RepID=A0A1H0CVS5_9ACTN|nr:hypothetical protein [Streptomyces wuyuanensis]SDN62033.1 hypothetical protein SAMN05444921_13150 [Streptomyces wuyuanensis]
MRGALPVAAAAGVLLLAGCSQSDGQSAVPGASAGGSSATAAAPNGLLTVPHDADEETRKQYLYQNAIAGCMRAQGFAYTPHVEDAGDVTPLPIDGQDYKLSKEYRGKYGYGFSYARVVYPHDPNVIGSETTTDDEHPNAAYREALAPAQQRAYDKAMGEWRVEDGKKLESPGCRRAADVKAYGPEKPKAERDREQEAAKAADRAAQQALDGDPQLVSLAQDYASCLRAEGITVTTTQPTSISDMVKFQVNNQAPADGWENLDKETARTKLAQEIGTALKDLECGKKFRAAYFPKLAENPFVGAGG